MAKAHPERGRMTDQALALLAAVDQHRSMYRDDIRIERLVARQPPLTVDPNTGQRHQEDGTRVGMTLSGRLLRYLGHPEGYGDAFPWSKALWRLRVECRRNHPYHRGPTVPYWRGSLCHQLVMFTVVRGWSIENTRRILRADNAESVLLAALRWLEEDMDRARELAERRAREDAGRGPGAVPEPTVGHHVPSEQHIAECPNPECRARRAA